MREVFRFTVAVGIPLELCDRDARDDQRLDVVLLVRFADFIVRISNCKDVLRPDRGIAEACTGDRDGVVADGGLGVANGAGDRDVT